MEQREKDTEGGRRCERDVNDRDDWETKSLLKDQQMPLLLTSCPAVTIKTSSEIGVVVLAVGVGAEALVMSSR